MSEFNLEKVKNGAPVVTRDGHQARVICTDRRDPKRRGTLLALVLGKSGEYEQIVQYDQNGRQINFVTNYDLLLKDDD